MVNAAILGLGRWGQLLHQSSLESQNLKVIGAATRTPANVEAYCGEHNLELYPDFDTLLQDSTVQAVLIATPHTMHFEQLLKCADAGKHVYCEKPFTLRSQDARHSLKALNDKGCKVAIGHNRRYAPNSRELFKRVKQGWFGNLQHIDAVFNAPMASSKGRWRDSVVESPAGGMTSLGIHAIDHIVHLMGEVESVRSDSRKINSECAFDDHTTVDFRFSSGAGGHLRTLTNTAMQWQITLYGDAGWMQLHDLNSYFCRSVSGVEEQHRFPGYDYPAPATITAALEAFAMDILEDQPFAVSVEEIQTATRILETVFDNRSGWKAPVP